MRREDRCRTILGGPIREIDTLGKLHNPISAKTGNHPLSEVLIGGPDIAKITAAVKENDAIAKSLRQLPVCVTDKVTYVGNLNAIALYVRSLPKPDCTVTHVVVIRKPKKRASPVLDERRKNLVQPVVKPRDDRRPTLEVCFSHLASSLSHPGPP
jgi:hypothetical protein